MGKEKKPLQEKNTKKRIRHSIIVLLLITLIIGLIRPVTINGETIPAFQYIINSKDYNVETSIMAPNKNYAPNINIYTKA